MRIALWLLFWIATSVQANTEPELALANKYRPGIDVGAYLISEKFDGVRAYWDGKQLLTRSGNVIPAPRSFLRQLPAEALDGELWFGRLQYSRANALVKRQPNNADYESEWKAVKYMVFDAPHVKGNFDERLAVLRKLITKKTPQIVVAAQWRVKDHAELQEHLKEISSQGAEGLMMRLRNAPYKAGRSDDLLKLKVWEEGRATVLSVIPGKGRFEGKVGSILVRLENGREIRIGSGFSEYEREEPPTIGSEITYRYQGYTSSGLPRFAHYWREDSKP